jgi:hypothetical protein
MDHETIGRKFLPILGWISIVGGYIALFGGPAVFLLTAIIYFAQGIWVLGIAYLLGGVPGSIIEGIACIAVGDMMVRFDDGGNRAAGPENRINALQASTKAKEKTAPKKSEPASEKTEPTPKKSPVAPLLIEPVPPKKSVSPLRRWVKGEGLVSGEEVSYQGHLAIVTYVLSGTGRASIKFENGQVEVVDIADLN